MVQENDTHYLNNPKPITVSTRKNIKQFENLNYDAIVTFEKLSLPTFSNSFYSSPELTKIKIYNISLLFLSSKINKNI